MTITRSNVESCLAYEVGAGSAHDTLLGELCRFWLAVDDAPIAETVTYGQCLVDMKTLAYIPAGTYKLVCIDTPTGGREGL